LTPDTKGGGEKINTSPHVDPQMAQYTLLYLAESDLEDGVGVVVGVGDSMKADSLSYLTLKTERSMESLKEKH